MLLFCVEDLGPGLSGLGGWLYAPGLIGCMPGCGGPLFRGPGDIDRI